MKPLLSTAITTASNTPADAVTAAVAALPQHSSLPAPSPSLDSWLHTMGYATKGGERW